MTNETTYTDIERAANTMLSKAQTYNETIKNYVERVSADPDFKQRIEEFSGKSLSLWRDGLDAMTLETYLDLKQESTKYLQRGLDSAALELANHVVAFRLNGRNAGDQIFTDQVYGAHSVSSLAARVAEFHESVVAAYNDAIHEAGVEL